MADISFIAIDGVPHDVKDTTARNSIGELAEVVNGLSERTTTVQRIESLDENNLVNLRDLESGSYVLYGYFTPYSGAPESFTIDNCFAAVVHLNAGSHVMVYSKNR